MDIEDARKAKAKAEADVREVLMNFARETGLEVVDVRFEMSVFQSFGSPNRVECTALVIDVKFDS